MKKIITFIVTVLLSLCAFAQSYDIKMENLFALLK